MTSAHDVRDGAGLSRDRRNDPRVSRDSGYSRERMTLSVPAESLRLLRPVEVPIARSFLTATSLKVRPHDSNRARGGVEHHGSHRGVGCCDWLGPPPHRDRRRNSAMPNGVARWHRIRGGDQGTIVHPPIQSRTAKRAAPGWEPMRPRVELVARLDNGHKRRLGGYRSRRSVGGCRP
jgi:hypothetical protein